MVKNIDDKLYDLHEINTKKESRAIIGFIFVTILIFVVFFLLLGSIVNESALYAIGNIIIMILLIALDIYFVVHSVRHSEVIEIIYMARYLNKNFIKEKKLDNDCVKFIKTKEMIIFEKAAILLKNQFGIVIDEEKIMEANP